MQIQSINNTNYQNTSFKKVYLIQVQQKAFANPHNYKECSSTFAKKMNKIMYSKFSNLIRILKKEPQKIITCMENPSYINAKTAMTNLNCNNSIQELVNKTGLPIKSPIENKYHSFFVYTGEHKEKIESTLRKPMENLNEYFKEGSTKFPNDRKMAIIYAQSKLGTIQDKEVKQLISDSQIKKFKLKNLNELKNIAKEFQN